MDDLEEVEAGDRMEMGVAMEFGEDDMVVVVVVEGMVLFARRDDDVRVEGMMSMSWGCDLFQESIEFCRVVCVCVCVCVVRRI